MLLTGEGLWAPVSAVLDALLLCRVLEWERIPLENGEGKVCMTLEEKAF
ncbi:MAG: hypothetical protein FWG59_01585 [Betaproteobacteria bacterium]|nr:hypothetical protein [Betaproteobacteria bacterium]